MDKFNEANSQRLIATEHSQRSHRANSQMTYTNQTKASSRNGMLNTGRSYKSKRDDGMTSPRKIVVDMNRVANSKSAMSQHYKLSPRMSPPRNGVQDPKA